MARCWARGYDTTDLLSVGGSDDDVGQAVKSGVGVVGAVRRQRVGGIAVNSVGVGQNVFRADDVPEQAGDLSPVDGMGRVRVFGHRSVVYSGLTGTRNTG